MYKNFRISEDEKKQILEMHRKQGYKRAINEDEESMNPESMGSQDTSVASPESGNQGIKPELVKVLKILAERSFPIVKTALSPVPFVKTSGGGGSTVYYGQFNPQNTPALQKNYKVPYEGIGHGTIYFSIQPNGFNAGISGEVLLNTFNFKARLTADEINKYTPNDLYGQILDGVKTPGGLINALNNQYIGIRNGAGKLELIQRMKEDGFKQEG